MYDGGEIVIVKNIQFKNRFADHASIGGRPCLVLSDINDKNMMYDENGGLKLIDTDLYETQLYKDFDKCYEWNMIELFNAIMDFIFFTKFVYFDNEKLDDLYRYCGYNGKLKPSEFLHEFVEFVNKNRNTNIKTLSNLRNKGYRYFKFR